VNDNVRLNRGEALSRILNGLSAGPRSIEELARSLNLGQNQVAPAVYRLVKQGRVCEVRREGRTVFYERLAGEAQIEEAARSRAILAGLGALAGVDAALAKAKTERTVMLEELERLREENARLRRAVKDMAGRL
jgi:DNA-binding transcriptional ArsR family regulator